MGWEMQELREIDGNQNETTTFVSLPVGAPLGLRGSLRIPLQRVAPGLFTQAVLRQKPASSPCAQR